MTPERAFGIGLRIAAETYDQLAELGDDRAPEQAAEIVLEAAKRFGCTDADAPALIEAWPKVMARVDELQRRVIDQETERTRVGIGHVIRRARTL
jgi:hypothetical protein